MRVRRFTQKQIDKQIDKYNKSQISIKHLVWREHFLGETFPAVSHSFSKRLTKRVVIFFPFIVFTFSFFLLFFRSDLPWLSQNLLAGSMES